MRTWLRHVLPGWHAVWAFTPRTMAKTVGPESDTDVPFADSLPIVAGVCILEATAINAALVLAAVDHPAGGSPVAILRSVSMTLSEEMRRHTAEPFPGSVEKGLDCAKWAA